MGFIIVIYWKVTVCFKYFDDRNGKDLRVEFARGQNFKHFFQCLVLDHHNILRMYHYK